MSEATKTLPATQVLTPKGTPVRLAFPALFKPRPKMVVPGAPVDPNNPPKLTYQAVLLLPPELDLTPFKKAMEAAFKEKFPGKKPTEPSPIKSCDDKSDMDGYLPGWHYINTHANANRRPGVVDQGRRPITDENAIFAGCYVRAHVNAFAWTFARKLGVSFGLMNIQLVALGERLGGASASPNDVFEALEDTGSDSPGELF